MATANDLDYRHLRYFWAVAKEGNLTRAAEKLRVTQSAVSVQIKKLEDTLGQPLFERAGRRLELTSAGRVALDYAEGIFAMGDELVGALGEVEGGVTRTLRVGVLATLSRNFQIAFLRPILRREDVRLRVRSGAVVDLLERLERHELDVVLSDFAPTRTEGAAWVANAIATQPVSLIGQPGRRRRRRLETLLRDEPLVVPPPDSGVRLGLDALLARLGVRPRIHAEVDDMAMLRLVAREHEGLSVIPPIVVRDELDDGTLEEVRQLPELEETFFALTMPRQRPNRLLEGLLEQARGGVSGAARARGHRRAATSSS